MQTNYWLAPMEYDAVLNTLTEAFLRIDGAQLLTNVANFLAKQSPEVSPVLEG